MELFSANYEENTRALDDLLGVGRCGPDGAYA